MKMRKKLESMLKRPEETRGDVIASMMMTDRHDNPITTSINLLTTINEVIVYVIRKITLRTRWRMLK